MNGALVVAGLVLAAIALLSIVKRGLTKRGLPAGVHTELLRELNACEAIPDPHRSVLEAEKVLHHALSILGYTGSFGEILKKVGPRLSQEQAVWDAHKLRNRIAHERELQVTASQAKHAIAAFRKALSDLR